jgi:type I restriction enzyme M protein
MKNDYGTTIAVNILVLSKHKPDTKTQFIDASGENFFKKETNNNVFTDDHIKEIMAMFDSKDNVDHVAKSVSFEDIVENDYNLAVSAYVEDKDTREKMTSPGSMPRLKPFLQTFCIKI